MTGENCYRFLGTQASLAFPRMELWRYTEKPGQGWLDPLKHFWPMVRGEKAPAIDALDGSASLAVA